MRIFLAGASGAIGKRLVPMLIEHGHQVVGTTRNQEKAKQLHIAGADTVILDALDRRAVLQAVVAARPDIVIHQLTSLASMRSLKNFDKEFAVTNRLRTDGTDYLLAAAREAGAKRFIAQSYTGWPNRRSGDRVQTENDPFEDHPEKKMIPTLDAIRRLEATVSGASDLCGIALRYGSLYGPGTSIAPDGEIIEAVRKRRLPVIGGGGGVWSFVHIDDAATATLLAVEGGKPGVYNIVDDDPAEVSVWLPELARAVGAAPPRHLPAWIGRVFIGSAGVLMMTEIRGSSNAKAKRLLNWHPRYSSWRAGFREGLSASGAQIGIVRTA